MKLEANESHWSVVTFGASGKGVCDSLPKFNETHNSIKRQRKYTQKASFRIKYLMQLQRPWLYKISLRDAPQLIRKVQFIFIRKALSHNMKIMFRLLRSASLLRQLWTSFPAACNVLQGRRRSDCEDPRMGQRSTGFVCTVLIFMK